MLKWHNHRAPGFNVGIHYAWVVIVISGLLFMVGGSASGAFGVLIVPLQDNEGWSPGSITIGYALAFITSALLAPISGIATDRYGARRVMSMGIVLFLLGTIMTGVVSQVWHIWISYGIILGAAQACFSVPIFTVASTWFQKRLGVGMGLLMAIQGLGPGVLAILLSLLLVWVDWKTAFWSIGVGGAIIMAGLLLVFRNRPSDIGIRPYGANDTEPIARPSNAVMDRMRAKSYAANMQATSAFWNLVAVHFLGCVGHAIVLVYIIPIAVEAGIDKVEASGILATLVFVSVVTRFVTPVAAENMGAKSVMAIMFLLQAVTVVMLFWAHDPWQFYLFAVIFGMGYGGESASFPIINRQYYGTGPMGRAFGWQMGGASIGMGVGGWLGGVLFGIFDSYNGTILLSAVTSGAGALIILSLASTRRRLIPSWEEPVDADSSPTVSGDVATAD